MPDVAWDVLLFNLYQRPPDELDDIDLARTLRMLEAKALLEGARTYEDWQRGKDDTEIDYELLEEIERLTHGKQSAR